MPIPRLSVSLHAPAAAAVLLLTAAACGGDDPAGPGNPGVGECSDAAVSAQRWEFDQDDDWEGWSADSLTSNDGARVSDGSVALQGRGGEVGVANAWMERSVTLPNSCQLFLRYSGTGAGLGSGALRVRYEALGSDHVLSDWVTWTGPGSAGYAWRGNEVDLAEFHGTSGKLVFEWDNTSSQSDDTGIMRLDDIVITAAPLDK